jgi:hypothetical protein
MARYPLCLDPCAAFRRRTWYRPPGRASLQETAPGQAREDKPAPLMGQSVNLGVDVRGRTLENRLRSGQSISSKSMSRAR